MLRPCAAAGGGHPAGPLGGRVRVRLHSVRGPRPHGARVATHRPGPGVQGAAGIHTLDHTSILKTIETRWGLRALTARDAAAPGLQDALTLGASRDDDPLAGVVVPTSAAPAPAVATPSHLQQVHAELVSQLPIPPRERLATPALAELYTPEDFDRYMRDRTVRWKRGAE